MEYDPLHERLRTVVGDRTYRAVGEITGTNAETARRYLQGQAPNIEFIAALCEKLGLNANWLLTGYGPMKAKDQRAHALREANPAELLSAIADALEQLTARVDRIEVYMQQLESIVRGRQRSSSPGESAQADRDGRARQDQSDADDAGRLKARVVAGALTKRPSANAG